jgi:hypothetical protein
LNSRSLATGLVAGLLIGAGLTYTLVGPGASRTVTATSVTTATSTSISVTTQATTQTQSAGVTTSSVEAVKGYAGQVFYRSNNGWNFSVTLSSLVVTQGQTIEAYINLTNISGQTQKVHEVNPLINPVIYCKSGNGYCKSGTQVWAWDPSEINFDTNVTAGSGVWDFSGPYPISTSNMSPDGLNYTLSIWPFIEPSATADGEYLLGQSLMINATISVS